MGILETFDIFMMYFQGVSTHRDVCYFQGVSTH